MTLFLDSLGHVRKGIFFLILFVLLGLALFFASTPSSQQQGPTRYVNHTDPTCHGKSPCYTTIQAAVNAALPGETIQIQAGSYPEKVSIKGKNNFSGASESDRIVIEADSSLSLGSVVISGNGEPCSKDIAIKLEKSKFITLQGLTISGAGQAIVLKGGNNQNQAIHIERNRIFGNGSSKCDGGITVGTGNAKTLIVNNLIHGNGRNGIAFMGSKGGPHYVVNNTLHANGRNGVSATSGQQVFLINNVITHNGREKGKTGGRFGVTRSGSSKTSPQGLELFNNLICGNQLGEIDGPALDTTDSGNLTPHGTEGPGVTASPGCEIPGNVYANINGPDNLPNTADDNFALTPSSPAIDKGMDPRALGLNILFNPIFEADFLTEAVRPSDGNADRVVAFDIGAFEVPNTPPVANAGFDQNTFRGALVTLDGTGSQDPEEAPLTFQWTIVSQPSSGNISLDNPTSSRPQFTPLFLGTYVFQLVVNDGEFDSAPATVRVTAINQPPTANANGPYTGTVGVPIQFTGSGGDPDGDPVTFSWDFGDENTASGATPTHTYTIPGTFAVTLSVADPYGGIATLQATATVETGLEISAVSPESGTVGTEVTIQGTGFDPGPGKTIVKFNNVQALITSITQATIRTFVPLGATTGRITVVTPQGTTTSAADFIVLLRQDFALSVSPGVGTTVQGTSASYAVQIASTGIESFTGLTQLTTGQLPLGVTATFNPSSLTSGTTGILTLAAANTALIGSNAIELRATAQLEGRSVTRTATITLGVQAPGQTILIGEVRDEQEKPLPGVSIKRGGSTITDLGSTDAGGNFFIPLSTTGPQVFLIDGSTANTPSINYSTIPVTLDIQPGVVNTLGFTPRLHGQPVAKLAPIIPGQGTVLTHPDVPGFTMTIPSGVQIIGWDGQPNNRFSVTTVPLDRSPLPPLPPELAARQVYLFSFGKMGGGIPTGNIPIDTPNDVGGLPGETIDLYYFNEAPDGTAPNRWEKYGTGTISSDGARIITDINPATGLSYGIPRFCCGARVNVPPPPPPRPGGGPSGGKSGSGKEDGEPVDTATGFFYLNKTDLVLPGILPIAMTRTYRTNLTNAGPFGLGTSWPYDIFLEPPPNGSPDSLILFTPGNRQDLFARQPDGSFVNTTSPVLRGAVVTVAGGIRSLRFKDGSLWRFDSAGKLVSQADRNGNILALIRDGQGRVVQIMEPAGRALTVSYTGGNLRIDTIRDPIGREVRYIYDGFGRLINVTDAAGGITSYTYDSSNRMVSITDPRDITFLINDYDTAGRVVRQTQADGGVWTFAYTAAGSFISQTTVTDPRGQTTTYRFNSDGYLINQTDVLGQTTTFERQPGTNLVLSTTDPLRRVVRFSYDANGNVTRITDPAGNVRRFEYEPIFNKLTRITDPLGQMTRFEYDARGNLTATIDPTGARTTITYNEFGQPVSTTDPLGNTTTFAYDDFGNLMTIADPLGNKTQRSYDLVSRLIEQTDPRGRSAQFTYDGLNRITEIVDALNGVTSFGYDGNGNLLTVTDARGNTITHNYDVMDRLSTRIDPLNRTEIYVYDPNGNLTQFTDRKGQLATFTYDSLNRRVQAAYADASRIEFVYDAVGRLVQMNDSTSGPIELTYDNLDRLIQEITGQGMVRYSYDVVGRRTSMTLNGQTPVTYDYDAASRITQVAQGSQVISLGYDATGRRTALSYPNGTSTNYTYDPANRLTRILHQGTAAVIEDLTYTYDAAGNRISFGKSGPQAALPQPVQAAYDAANQQIQFNFDSPNLTYDANGNLTSQTDAGGTTTYTWDARNRLVGISGPSLSAGFIYDALGRRASKTVNGVQTEYQYDGNDIIAEFANGAPAATYLRSRNIDEPFVRQSSSTEYYHADALGSVLALTDQNGTGQTTYTYEPFGSTTIDGASANPFQFTGRENDGTGLYYYRARYYSPTLQRFINEDPIGFSGGDINLHAYVGNNPTRYVDPLGLFVFPLVAIPATAIPGSNIPIPSPENAAIPLPFITYGNYGGKGWTGGWTGDRSPIDSLDECFKTHDECYAMIQGTVRKGSCSGGPTQRTCDKKLVDCMRRLPTDPGQWQRPAPNPSWANVYKYYADWYFTKF